MCLFAPGPGNKVQSYQTKLMYRIDGIWVIGDIRGWVESVAAQRSLLNHTESKRDWYFVGSGGGFTAPTTTRILTRNSS